MKFYKNGSELLLEPKDSRLVYCFGINDGSIKGKYFRTDPCVVEMMDAGLLQEIPEEMAIAEAKMAYNKLAMLYSKARDIAKDYHAGQIDKAGADYYTAHVLPVSEKVNNLFPGNGLLPIVALLHDMLEDTAYTKRDLENDFPQEVVDAVVALTRKKGETYDEYIARVVKNDMAKRVKICDLTQNMDLSRLPNKPTDKDRLRVIKYQEALIRIMKSI